MVGAIALLPDAKYGRRTDQQGGSPTERSILGTIRVAAVDLVAWAASARWYSRNECSAGPYRRSDRQDEGRDSQRELVRTARAIRINFGDRITPGSAAHDQWFASKEHWLRFVISGSVEPDAARKNCLSKHDV
jgi:hypothetical protein